MFDIGWGEILVLVIAGLFILGPERLPGAARWLGQTLRQIREYATGARDQLRNELGPEFDELRKPLEDLNQLRSFNPRSAITQHLFGEEDGFGSKPNDFAPPASSLSAGAAYQAPPPPQRPLESGERPPYDPDAT